MIRVYVEWEDGMSVCMGVCTWMTVKCVRVAQWIRRPPTKREIAGSSPVVDFLFFLMHRDVSRNPGFESQSPPSFLTLFHNKLSYTWISTVYCLIHFIPIIYSSYAAWYLYDSNSFCVLTKYPTYSIHKTYLSPFYIGCIASRWVWATSSDASQWDAYMLVGGTHTVFKGHRHIGKPKHCFVTITRT